jgi:glycosyltransferase involved in cell wall biosynthesis
MNSGSVSVIIPVYNGADYAAEAIGSVLAQAGHHTLEIIVMDDGSSDDRAAVAQACASGCGPVSLQVTRRTNGGPAAARNTGLALARGELIAFLDADDLYLPEKLVLQPARLHAWSERGIVIGRRQYMTMGTGIADLPPGNQECLVHVERGLCGKLSWKHRKEVVGRMNRLRGVQGAEAREEAFGELLEFVRGKNLAAAENLESRKDGILSFHRLDVPVTLNLTFLSTDHIENVMRNTRGVIGKVCRWHPKTDQLARWMGVALLRAHEGFRRVRGQKEMGICPSQWGRSFGACGGDRILLPNVHQPAC